MPDITTVRLREGVTLDDLSSILAKIVDLQGCPACGLNGFDLRFEVDPEIRFAELREQFATQIVGIDVNRGALQPARRLG
ncbi:hypothetical protein BN12_50042 [Nostocoides japonicum T1-X7]|uniref:Uncharacterized protein n=1 Tax=Nostocoides japonicum T1-X7 TaxID=1194083 RepID=A0A077M6E5_9MICO|nr:hypothetical protein [Tetrasphaera japonica]CCH79615.1 hypothetical protein BN12_50042 [Tetrasphaera japonica T1-X7]